MKCVAFVVVLSVFFFTPLIQGKPIPKSLLTDDKIEKKIVGGDDPELIDRPTEFGVASQKDYVTMTFKRVLATK